MKRGLWLVGPSILIVLVLLSGCQGSSQFISADRINEQRNDYYAITQQQFDQIPVSIQKALTNLSEQINITSDDLEEFLTVTQANTTILHLINQGEEYCSWWGYLEYQNSTYRIRFCFTHTNSNFTMIQNLDDIALSMTEQEINNFPHLKDAIVHQTWSETPLDEFYEVRGILTLEDTEYIKYQNNYYRISLYFAD